MEATAQRELAEDLSSAVTLCRVAEAGLLSSLCEFAEAYRVDAEDLLEVLAERRIQIGGEGTPRVSEYLMLELAGLLRCTPAAAGHRVVEALNLKHRHPGLFAAVRRCQIDADRALRAAVRCGALSQAAAEAVTQEWFRRQGGLGWTASFNLLDKLVKEADLEAAAEKERKAREDRGVFVWGLSDGVMNLTGRLDVLDARHLDASVEQMAEVIEGDHPGLTKDQRRAKALGILAQPARALALLQRAAQPELPPEGSEAHGERHGCRGELCGTVTTPLSRLRPKVSVAVHVHSDAVGRLTGLARVERAGWITTGLLTELLGDADVTVRPVIDLANVPAEDGYVPSAGLRRAVCYALRHELFPYSNLRAERFDLDHTVPYLPGRRGQTRLGNLAPLSRRAHRAKTAGIWRSRQAAIDQIIWESPLGYRYEVSPSGTRSLE